MLFYIDGGSASMITQAVVAGAAGTAVVVKTGWKRMTSPFRRKDAAGAELPQPTDSWDAPGGEG